MDDRNLRGCAQLVLRTAHEYKFLADILFSCRSIPEAIAAAPPRLTTRSPTLAAPGPPLPPATLARTRHQAPDRLCFIQIAVVLTPPTITSPCSCNASVNSNFAVAPGLPTSLRLKPSNCHTSIGAFCNMNITWKSGGGSSLFPAATLRRVSRTASPDAHARPAPTFSPPQQLAETRIAAHITAQHQRIDEEANQPFRLRAIAIGDRCADYTCSCPA